MASLISEITEVLPASLFTSELPMGHTCLLCGGVQRNSHTACTLRETRHFHDPPTHTLTYPSLNHL